MRRELCFLWSLSSWNRKWSCGWGHTTACDSMHQCMSDSDPLLSAAWPSLPQLMCDMRSHLHHPFLVAAPPQGVGAWVGFGSGLAGVAEPVDQVPHVRPNTRTRRTLAFPRAVGEHTVTDSLGSSLGSQQNATRGGHNTLTTLGQCMQSSNEGELRAPWLVCTKWVCVQWLRGGGGGAVNIAHPVHALRLLLKETVGQRPKKGFVYLKPAANFRPPKNTKGHRNPKNVAGPSPAPGSRSVGAACLSHRLQHARLEYGRWGGQWDGPHAGVSPADVLCSGVVPQAECRTHRTCASPITPSPLQFPPRRPAAVRHTSVPPHPAAQGHADVGDCNTHCTTVNTA